MSVTSNARHATVPCPFCNQLNRVELGPLAAGPRCGAAAPPAARRREYRVLNPGEARIFLKEVERDDLAALWTLLLMTGLRPAEALGPKWEDLDGDRLAVRRAFVRSAGGAWELAETKTRRGRTVTLPGPVVKALSRHRARQSQARLLLGPEYAGSGLVFASTFGEPLWWANVVRRHFAPVLARTAVRLSGVEAQREALAATGLDRMRPYDLRHSAATLLLAAGEHPKVVAELLGHSKITLTLDTYSHVTPALLEQAARRMEDLVTVGEVRGVRWTITGQCSSPPR